MAFILDTFPSDFSDARAYSTRVYALLNNAVRALPQGEAASMQARAGLVVEAKVDAKWNVRYTVRRDGAALRGISALFMALEAHWQACAALEAQLNAQVAHKRNCADAANLAAFEGVSDQTAAQLADRPETLRVVAGIARLFLAGMVSKLGALEAMQAAGLPMPDAQAESDHLADTLANGGDAEAMAECLRVGQAAQDLKDERQDDAAKGDFAVALSDGLRPVGTVRVRAYNSTQASALAVVAWPGTVASGPAVLCAGQEPQPPVTLTLSYADALRLRRICREARDSYAATGADIHRSEGTRAIANMWHDAAAQALAQMREAIAASKARAGTLQAAETHAETLQRVDAQIRNEHAQRAAA